MGEAILERLGYQGNYSWSKALGENELGTPQNYNNNYRNSWNRSFDNRIQCNYRGSSGYGDAFLRDLAGHIFNNAHLDVLAGVDYLVKTGIADPDRMVKMGWSWGAHILTKSSPSPTASRLLL